MTAMNQSQRDAFLAGARIATLVTLNPDDSPTGVPVWFEWDGTTAIVFTSATSPKVARIRRDGRVCLTIAEPAGLREAWVTIEGIASIENHGGIELARRLAPRYYTPERAAAVMPGWEAAAASWVVIRITPTRIRSVGPGM
jgi:PPOX class probable F420-dependent enzyme